MVNARAAHADALQFEALLIARAYIYEMFYHLTGGVPTADLLGAISGETVQSVLDEYEGFDEMSHLAKLLSRYADMDDSEAEGFIDRAKDEFTRVFIGPASLPASPYESPYRGSHDTALLQENTLAVRQAYRRGGFEPKRLHAIPDDHIAFMCSFMAVRALSAARMYEMDDKRALSVELVEQSGFLDSHMVGWIDVFAESVATSDAASGDVLYPSVLKALGAFVRADGTFLLEGSAWLDEEPVPEVGGDKADQVTQALEEAKSAFKEVRESLTKLQGVEQLGLADYSLVRI